MEQRYQGKLTLYPDYLDTAGILCLQQGEQFDFETPLAEKIADHIKAYGDYLLVRYWIASQSLNAPQTSPQAELVGKGTARYSVYYDEWDDEDGSHNEFDGYVEEFLITDRIRKEYNALEELKSHEGKYVYLVIDYHEDEV